MGRLRGLEGPAQRTNQRLRCVRYASILAVSLLGGSGDPMDTIGPPAEWISTAPVVPGGSARAEGERLRDLGDSKHNR